MYAPLCSPTLACRQKDWPRRLSQRFTKEQVRVFRKLLLNVKYKDEAQLRYEMKQFLGGHSAYYRYMNGKLTLLPELQEGILHLFREHGYTEDLVFDNYINRYVYE